MFKELVIEKNTRNGLSTRPSTGPSTGSGQAQVKLRSSSRPFDAYNRFIEAEGHEPFDMLRTLRLSKGKRKGAPTLVVCP